jgi:hypothetical protein
MGDYHQSLGKFVTVFTVVEGLLTKAIGVGAMLPPKIAIAILSGSTRVNSAMEITRRLLAAIEEIGKLDPMVKLYMTQALDQLALINSIRNDILHFGPIPGSTDDVFVISNRHHVHLSRNLRERLVTPATLEDMSGDLVKIAAHIIVCMIDADIMKLDAPGNPFLPILQASWRYKPAGQQTRNQRNQ